MANIGRDNEIRLGRATWGRNRAVSNDGSKPGALVSLHQRFHSFGAIAAAVANAVATTQAVVVGTSPLVNINGALAAGGVATFPVARNVVLAWTGTAVATVTGRDDYGQRMQEVSASGTSLTGKKAFKYIDSISMSADVTALTAGTGVAIGLLQAIADNGLQFARVTATAGAAMAIDAATVLGPDVTNPAIGTGGDVRGTIQFASAPDGVKTYGVAWFIRDRQTKIGVYGVRQFGSADGADPT